MHGISYAQDGVFLFIALQIIACAREIENIMGIIQSVRCLGMHLFATSLAGALFLAGCLSTGTAQLEEEAAYRNPDRFEAQIQEFEAADAEAMPPEGAIVGLGSSSMRGWHGSIHEDLAPLTVIPRGFGGSTMYDALHYLDRVVFPYRPRAILLYEGDNDIAFGIATEKYMATFEALVEAVHEELPETRIYVLAIKPSISRWAIWPQMQEANAALEAACEEHALLTYIDIATPMLLDDGTPNPDIFLDDMLHMSAKGYEVWTKVVRPVLLEAELEYETE